MYSESDGVEAVRIAREAAEAAAAGRSSSFRPPSPAFERKAGVFVTLATYPKDELRGCIGFPEPVLPLLEALVRAAESAATDDPRFDPVRPEEFDRLVAEVSLLTPPELVLVDRAADIIGRVEVGRHGLLVVRERARGLLLPQVAVDYGWDGEEFLAQTCMKAGLRADAWSQRGTLVYTFEAELFREARPRGEVVRRVLGDAHARARR